MKIAMTHVMLMFQGDAIFHSSDDETHIALYAYLHANVEWLYVVLVNGVRHFYWDFDRLRDIMRVKCVREASVVKALKGVYGDIAMEYIVCGEIEINYITYKLIHTYRNFHLIMVMGHSGKYNSNTDEYQLCDACGMLHEKKADNFMYQLARFIE